MRLPEFIKLLSQGDYNRFTFSGMVPGCAMARRLFTILHLNQAEKCEYI
jgi:hypothetical protein